MTLEEEVRDFKDQGHSVFVISNRLNLTTSDVREALNGKQLDMGGREMEARKLRREGYSLLYIANRLNLTMSRAEEFVGASV